MGGISRRTTSAQRRLAWFLTALLTITAAAALPALADDTAAASPVAEQVAKALNLCWNGEFDQSLKMASALLDQGDLSREDRVAVYSALSTINYYMGKAHRDEAFSYLDKIREIDPCLASLPSDFWAKPLREQWYRVLQANHQLTCDLKSPRTSAPSPSWTSTTTPRASTRRSWAF